MAHDIKEINRKGVREFVAITPKGQELLNNSDHTSFNFSSQSDRDSRTKLLHSATSAGVTIEEWSEPTVEGKVSK